MLDGRTRASVGVGEDEVGRRGAGVLPEREGKERKVFIYLFICFEMFSKKKSGVVGFVFFMYLLDLNYSKLIGRLKIFIRLIG